MLNGNIAIIICNYNKKEYVLKNIESLKKQTNSDFDVCVIDNASTDGSADAIEKAFSDVEVIRNESNLGGSGGFNTGMRHAVGLGYRYIVLLDNDVIVKENAIEQLCRDMDENPDVGIMGAKILKMDYPDVIQEFAPTINYKTMTFELNHGGERDNDSLPHFIECDYVPACALIIRTDVINKIGFMPKENFIYYDDIEWCVRCWRAGYKVVANSAAIVWHKSGAQVNPSTFGTYYLNRNKLRFFLTYSQTRHPGAAAKPDVDSRIDDILRDIYEGVYSCTYRSMINVAKTRMDAFLDALAGKTGKADEFEIREREIIDEKFDLRVKASKSIRIYMNGMWENTRRVLNHIQVIESETGNRVDVELIDSHKYEKKEMLGVNICSSSERSDESFDMVFHICKHIYELQIDSYEHDWVDGWRNAIFDEEDFKRCKAFAESYHIFKMSFEDRILDAMNKLNGDYARG